MNYSIQHETNHYIRIRLTCGKINGAEEEILRDVLSQMKQVKQVKIYAGTGGIALTYDGNREQLLEKLSALQYRNIEYFADELERRIGVEEIARRKLSPEVKRKMRSRMLLETVADIALPMPIQVGYHLYQLVTLKGM